MKGAHDHARWYVNQVVVPAAQRLAAGKLRRRRRRHQRARGQSPQPKPTTTLAAATWSWGDWLRSVAWVAAVCIAVGLVVRWRRQLRAFGVYLIAPSEAVY